jgi:hypothetical protein
MDTVGDTDTLAPEPVAVPTTTELLAVARQAHGAAIENASAARDRAGCAEAAHRQALAARQTLLDRAAAGETIDQADLTAASNRANEIRDAADLAVSIAAGAGVRADKAGVAALHAEASHIRVTYDEALADRLAKAGLVDATMAQLQDAIAAYNETNLTVGFARSAAHRFNGGLDAHAQSNAALRALDPGLMPRAAVPQTVPLRSIQAAFVDRSGGDLAIWRFSSVAAFVRSMFGLPQPDAAEQAARADRDAKVQVVFLAQALAGVGKGAPSFEPTERPSRMPR